MALISLLFAVVTSYVAYGQEKGSPAAEKKTRADLEARVSRIIKSADFWSAQRKEIPKQAKRFAEQWKEQGIEVLVAEAKDNWQFKKSSQRARQRTRQELAIWTLGCIGTPKSVAALVAVGLAAKSNFYVTALFAILEAPRDQARLGLESLIGNDITVAWLLRVVGNKDTITLCERLQGMRIDVDLKRAIEMCQKALEYKLNVLNKKKQKEYEEFELVFWKAEIMAPMTRRRFGGTWHAAGSIDSQVKEVPTEFLERKLDPETATPTEIALTACYCAIAKVDEAIPFLEKLAGKPEVELIVAASLQQLKNPEYRLRIRPFPRRPKHGNPDK